MSDHHDTSRPSHRRPSTPSVARDLQAIVDDTGGFLLLHPSVTERYEFEPGELPETTRLAPEDGWGDAIEDPEAILVWVFQPMRDHRRPSLEGYERHHVELGHFPSGNYAGASLKRANGGGGTYRGGESFRVLGEFLRLRCQDGHEVVVDETNHGFLLRDDRAVGALDSLLRDYRFGYFQIHPITDVTCDAFDRDQVLDQLTTARILNPGPITINGEVWP